mgnify:CR=1 FL=1
MKKINQLHIIENKKSLQNMDSTDKFVFEEDAKLMIESLKAFSSSLELLKNITILQPSKYDITLSTQNYFKNNNVKFIKKELYNPQKEETNKVTNYTVIPIGIDYLVNESNLFEEDSYVFYTDLDVIYLKDLHSLLESVQTTINEDKMICTLLPWKQTAENFNGLFRFDYIFQILKQAKIPDQFIEHFKLNNLNTFVNTWFIYAHKNHIFFKEFKKLLRLVSSALAVYSCDEIKPLRRSGNSHRILAILSYWEALKAQAMIMTHPIKLLPISTTLSSKPFL